MNKKNKENRIGEKQHNSQGCMMKIVEYNNPSDIVVEFQDERKLKVNSQYSNFKLGNIKNPYYPSVCGVGITGNKYPISINCELTKEYDTWYGMLRRCFSKKVEALQPTYKDVSCSNEWLYYENFYEWLHKQDNFDKWLNGKWWALDKDILVKNNKIYSPETCCLVPQNVNCLLLKRKASRGDLPIGVRKKGELYEACCSNPITNKLEHLGKFETPEQAFLTYKIRREDIIKQVAKIEYDNGNITKLCYDAMVGYEIDITD